MLPPNRYTADNALIWLIWTWTLMINSFSIQCRLNGGLLTQLWSNKRQMQPPHRPEKPIDSLWFMRMLLEAGSCDSEQCGSGPLNWFLLCWYIQLFRWLGQQKNPWFFVLMMGQVFLKRLLLIFGSIDSFSGSKKRWKSRKKNKAREFVESEIAILESRHTIFKLTRYYIKGGQSVEQ